MYLTDKKNGAIHDLHEHDELEILLESFSKQVEEIVNEAENIEVLFRLYHHPTADLWRLFHIEQCTVYTRNCRINLRL